METTRRNFMKQTALATTALGLVNLNPLTSRGATIAPTDKINVAIIGCKNMGFGILKHHLSYADANCVAMCDVDSRVLNERADEIRKTFNQSPKLYKDFRKMLEQKDIDAVIVGTPDHWHCLAAVYSLQAGKHVYVEKPMANTIAECNIMVKAANYYKKVVQVGQQQRSGAIFQKSMEFIKTGKIGKLRKVNIWANGMEYGIAFVCDDATIVADRTKMFVYPEWDEKGKKARAEEFKFLDGKDSHREHVRNFLDCIKSGQKNACPPETGRVAALHVHIANIAARVGEPVLLWDDEKNLFTNSKAANELITPIYRSPWTLPQF